MAMFTATVAANAPGEGTPTGDVTFYANGTSIGMGMLSVINGQDEASLTTSTLSTAPMRSPRPTRAAMATSTQAQIYASVAQVVNMAGTSTAVAAAPNRSSAARR